MIGNHVYHTNDVLHEVRTELERAVHKFQRPQSSPHEGYGVLAEEVHEFFLEVIANDNAKARKELIQVAAMAVRTILEVYDRVQVRLPDAAEVPTTEELVFDMTQGVGPGRLTKDTKQEPRKNGNRCIQCGAYHDCEPDRT